MTGLNMPDHGGMDIKQGGYPQVALWRAGVTILVAAAFLSGCAQGRGDWPTLASALGWGGDSVPPPNVEVFAPASVPTPTLAASPRGAPDLMEWTPPPAPVQQAVAPPPISVAPPPIPITPTTSSYSYGGNSDVVTEAFSEGLAATAPTIRAAPAGPTFASSGAEALTFDLSGNVPRVVSDTYNQSLSEPVPGSDRSAGLSLSGEINSQSTGTGVEYLDPVVIKFKRGSSRLSPRDKRRIGRVVKDYRTSGGTVYVIGHASSRTGDMKKVQHDLVNFDISLDRADAVTGELLNQGVAPEHLMMEARADRDPIYYEYMPLGEAGNQRVEIFRE